MKFDVIYADPPWSFDNKATGGSHKSGASQVYATLALEHILALPVQAIAAPNSVLFLWCPTALKFSHGWPVMRGWGYDYKTTIYWNKLRLGMGFWFRNQVEELLVGVSRCGNVAPFRCQTPNILSLPTTDHSAKPEAFRKMIEQATGTFSRRHSVELFGRQEIPGWTVIGKAVTKRDIREDIRLLVAA